MSYNGYKDNDQPDEIIYWNEIKGAYWKNLVSEYWNDKSRWYYKEDGKEVEWNDV